jgi:hypothetical protein
MCGCVLSSLQGGGARLWEAHCQAWLDAEATRWSQPHTAATAVRDTLCVPGTNFKYVGLLVYICVHHVRLVVTHPAFTVRCCRLLYRALRQLCHSPVGTWWLSCKFRACSMFTTKSSLLFTQHVHHVRSADACLLRHQPGSSFLSLLLPAHGRGLRSCPWHRHVTAWTPGCGRQRSMSLWNRLVALGPGWDWCSMAAGDWS